MGQLPRDKMTLKDWLVIVAPLTITVIGVTVGVGGYISQTNGNTRDIAELKASEAVRYDKLNDKLDGISDRTVRIETKVQLLLPDKDPSK